jgi:uncharacterized protein YbaA (DUF1428 family)
MSYVDGFIVPVPKDQLGAYRAMARVACKVWMEHGALDYQECLADDVAVGKVTSFPRSVKLKPDEIVIFSYIVYTSRKARDRTMAKVMKDPRLGGDDGSQGDAVRRQADDFRRIHADREFVKIRRRCRPGRRRRPRDWPARTAARRRAGSAPRIFPCRRSTS